MIKRPFRYHKKGNVILIAICVVVALLILLASFLKSTTHRMHTTKKLSNIMIAREFASSLALLFSNYVKINELRNPESELRKALSLAYDDMANKKTENKTEDFKNFIKTNTNNNGEDILTLLEKESGLKDLKWNISWGINKKDFQTFNVGNSEKPPYPREKHGYIRYNISISYVPPGAKTSTTEDYTFISSMNVVANIFPVLSKFNFYVENVFGGDEACDENTYRFNVVDTMASGDLNNGAKIRPWVMNNGDASDDAKNTYNDLVNDPRGFIYLGGGKIDKPILLGIARGWANDGFGKYGEDFHFFKNENRKAGYWKTVAILNASNRQGIMTSNIGLCNDVSDDNLLSWQEQLAGIYDEKSKYHSIFKLYGTDARKSPTMVLGYVDSICDSIRIFKDGTNGVHFLGYISTELEFLSGLGYEVNDWEPFGSGYNIKALAEVYQNLSGSELDHETYNKEYSSRLLSSRYNNDYTYILTNNSVDYPISRGSISDEKLKQLCDNKNDTILKQVPFSKEAKYNEIFGDDLTDLDTFLNKEKLFIDGSGKANERLACSAKVKNEEEIFSFLKANELFVDKKLNLNGFVYFESDENTEFQIDKCKVISNGGIILSNGDIRIKSDIEAESNAHLTLFAQKGNIVIERSVKKIDASLISGGGQIKLEGDARDSELTVNGNIVMKLINRGDVKDNSLGLKRGLNLNYKNELSAIPFNASQEEDRSETSLLMFNIKDDLKMLD